MEVKVTKCENGHYYDVNKYQNCPHCGAGEFTATVKTQKKLFGFMKKDTAKPTADLPNSLQFSKEIVQQSVDLLYEDVKTTGAYISEQLPVEDVKTSGIFVSAPAEGRASMENYPRAEVDDKNDVTTGYFATATETEQSANLPAMQSESAGQDSNTKTTGFFAVTSEFEQKVDSRATPGETTVQDSDVKTMGFFSAQTINEKQTGLLEQVKAVTDDNDAKTTGFFAVKEPAVNTETCEKVSSTQLPVGWLVCIAGKNVGVDYRVFVGKNSIGRSTENAIDLSGETSVSREKHAWVIFEPKKQEFFLKPGDGNSLVYLNDENVFDTVPLHNGDILELGNVKLLFVALCGPNFSWDNYLDKE